MEVVLDALKDTALVFPFILIIYILIELLERGTSFTRSRKMLQGKLAPLLGAATGIIPQCGFSVMAAKLYDKGIIRTGTVLAVFLATSDEALVILLANSPTSGTAAQAILPLILIKLCIALIVGYTANLILPDKIEPIAPLTDEKEENNEDGDDHAHAHIHEHETFSCGRDHEGKTALRIYLIDPLLHSLKITLYLLLVNLVMGFIIEAVGEDSISSSLIGGTYFQPFITAAVGLIPNCASSVIITSAYVSKGIMFGSCVAGLCTNAGLGFVVLLKNTKKIKRNVLLMISVYLISVLFGIAINAVCAACGIL